MEALYQQLAQLANTYASRIYMGQTLAEHEALCYIQVCEAIGAYTRFQAAMWTKQASYVEKQIEEEQARKEGQ